MSDERKFQCLRHLARLMEAPGGANVPGIFAGVPEIVRRAWGQNGEASVRLRVHGEIHVTPGFSESGVRQARPLIFQDKVIGALEVFTHPLNATDHFDTLLLESVAEQLNHLLERDKSAEALRNSAEWFRAIFQSSRDAVFIIDKESRIVDLNEAASALTGYDSQELRDMQAAEIHAPENRAAAQGFIERTLGCGAMRMETEILRKNGDRISVECISQSVNIGEQPYIHMLARDISERKHAEAHLRQSEATIRTILESAPIGIGEVKNRILGWTNRMMTIITGYSTEEMMNQGARMLYPTDEEFERVGRVKHAQVLALGVGTMETVFRRKTGETIPVLMSSAALVPGDLAHGLIFTVTDLTEQKHIEAERLQAEAQRELLEEQVRQSQKMEAIGQLAGGVAHDFNNLLQVIKGNTQMALEDTAPDHPAYPNLEEISGASERAGELVVQLLTFSRRLPLQPQFLDIDQVIVGLLKLLRRVISERIELELQAPENLPVVLADRSQIEQIVMNLCVNARDAIPEGGRIQITTRQASINEAFAQKNPWARPGEYVECTVSDNGCGIPADTLEHIFEPFFTTKEAGRGTGLGLATVYAIVQRHKGLIHVCSKPHQGTSVSIYLPCTQDHAPSPTLNTQTDEPVVGNETLLLAEDDELVRGLATKVLRKAGYTVLVAQNGKEALDLFENNSGKIRAVILDIVMPRMNGTDVARKINAVQPSLPIIFCSGYGFSETTQPGDALDQAPLLRKPYEPHALLRTLRRLIDKPTRTA